MQKPNHKVFTLAAQMLTQARESAENSEHSFYSRFACDCIYDARVELFGPNDYYETTPEQQFFEENFKPQSPYDAFGWWKTGNYDNNFKGHDWESRILALLLCAEMLKSGKH